MGAVAVGQWPAASPSSQQASHSQPAARATAPSAAAPPAYRCLAPRTLPCVSAQDSARLAAACAADAGAAPSPLIFMADLEGLSPARGLRRSAAASAAAASAAGGPAAAAAGAAAATAAAAAGTSSKGDGGGRCEESMRCTTGCAAGWSAAGTAGGAASAIAAAAAAPGGCCAVLALGHAPLAPAGSDRTRVLTKAPARQGP